MEALLRKYDFALDLLVIAACAVFLARALEYGVEGALPIPPPAAPSAPRAVAGKHGGDFPDRNLFCSTCSPVRTGTAPPTPRETSLPLVLVAVVQAPPPLAVIRDTEDRSLGAFAVNGRVRAATITLIGQTRIYLDNAGTIEYLDLRAPPRPAAALSSDPMSQEMDRGIRWTGEHSYRIERATLEAVLANTNLLSRSARIVPEVRDGRVAGFRLYAVRPDGPLARIGILNGDVVVSVNGLELTSIEKSLELFSKVRSAAHLSLGVERNGRKVTLEYGVQ